MATSPDSELVCLDDYRRAAAAVLDDRALAWIDGGAADEMTVVANVAAWAALTLAPRMLAGAADPDPGVVVLGRPRPIR